MKINKKDLLKKLESVRPGLSNKEIIEFAELERVKFLKGMSVTPFAQPYRDLEGTKPKRELRDFARWVNTHKNFYACSWDEYKKSVGYNI